MMCMFYFIIDAHEYISMSLDKKTIAAQQEKLGKSLLSCKIDPADLKIMEKVGQGK